jgi:hypothetical protein
MIKDGGESNPILSHRNKGFVERNPIYAEKSKMLGNGAELMVVLKSMQRQG